MTRAPSLPREERRRVLVEATIPLLLQHGRDLTTRQVAEAAGCAEGTIFRVFSSKDDLIHTTAQHALDHDGLAAALADLPQDADLRTTVTAAVDAIAAIVHRTRALVEMFHATARPTPAPAGTCPRPDPGALNERARATLTAALAPHADALRCSPDLASSALLACTFGALHPLAGSPELAEAHALVDLVLHGIAKENAC